MIENRYRFDDEQMKAFFLNGFAPLKLDLPRAFHDSVCRQTESVFARQGNPGNNILPWVPDLLQVFEHPVVRGALASILGPGYVMHAHRHCHLTPPGGKGGGWHKDSYWGYQKVRHHRPRWAMIFYYPQGITEENGPTAVAPGTQYSMDRPGDLDENARYILGEAGTLALVHFDIWHRATPNCSDRNRYMMKFQFTRAEEPDGPAWNTGEAGPPANGTPDQGRRMLLSSLWNWAAGRETPHADHAGTVPELARALNDASEAVRLKAAYALGTIGAPAVPALAQVLRGESEPARLCAAYGLGAVGASAVPALVEALEDENERVLGYAAYALGDMGAAAGEAVPALAGLGDDASAWVRQHAVEALGTIARNAEAAVPALCRALNSDSDAQVRFNAAYALMRFGPAAASAVPALRDALADDNRYVRGHSVAALRRIRTPEATQTLLDYLTATRWCPLTTKESMY